MHKNRLEFFSDGVLAILITIMVIELRAPHGDSIGDFIHMLPAFLTYILSFSYVGIYWNNHHHLLHTVKRATGIILLANLHFLFWISLLPFGTQWMGEHPNSRIPTMIYGGVLTMTAIAYNILQGVIIKYDIEHGTFLQDAIGKDFKGKMTIAICILGVLSANFSPLLGQMIYLMVAIIWGMPDRRIESKLHGWGKTDNSHEKFQSKGIDDEE